MKRSVTIGLLAAAVLLAQGTREQASGTTITGQSLPNTGQQITPTAPTNSRFEPLNPELSDFPDYTAGQAVTTLISPDSKTLLILTSGYNLVNATSGSNLGDTVPADSTEFIFIYDISNGNPIKKQVIAVPNTYM